MSGMGGLEKGAERPASSPLFVEAIATTIPPFEHEQSACTRVISAHQRFVYSSSRVCVLWKQAVARKRGALLRPKLKANRL